jgi:hypothetical protein
MFSKNSGLFVGKEQLKYNTFLTHCTKKDYNWKKVRSCSAKMRNIPEQICSKHLSCPAVWQRFSPENWNHFILQNDPCYITCHTVGAGNKCTEGTVLNIFQYSELHLKVDFTYFIGVQCPSCCIVRPCLDAQLQ